MASSTAYQFLLGLQRVYLPSGKYAGAAEAAQAFAEARDKTIAYVTSTNDDLRTHIVKAQAGSMDAYQFLLVIAAGSARQAEQIREVESGPNYPERIAQ